MSSTTYKHIVNFVAEIAVVAVRTHMTGKNGPPVGVGTSFPLWKEEGGGGVLGGLKKTSRPYILFSNPDSPLT
jgi:hypothetical protein